MTATVEPTDTTGPAGSEPASQLIDAWFPCAEVDQAVGTPAGSGLSEKALFTWFASRPIAQARAAALCSLLPDSDQNRADIRAAVLTGDPAAMGRLRDRVLDQYDGRPPVVLDMFSGRGIIPLEAARAGANAIGTDLSPVATLAGRLLADYPLRDWTAEPPLPFTASSPDEAAPDDGAMVLAFDVVPSDEQRLLADVRAVLAEVGRRVAAEVADLYPPDPVTGAVPWAYLWAVTIPCDACTRRFPLIGSMVLRHPYKRTGDDGQSLALVFNADEWGTRVGAGSPTQQPTFASPPGKKGKSARCPFPGCGHVHALAVVKAKGFAGQYQDRMLAVAAIDPATNQKVFRTPRKDEADTATSAHPDGLRPINGMSAVPDEPIPDGNKDNVRASGYGYLTYGSLMNDRQAVLFATTVQVIYDLFGELRGVVSDDYSRTLCGYAAANVVRQLKYSTRGAGLQKKGKPDGSAQNRVMTDHIFSSQSVLKHQFDYLEAGSSQGPGTWTSVSDSLINSLSKVLAENRVGGRPGRFRRETAIALPFRDATVDAVLTDCPYYNMIAYADASDIFYVWLKRALAIAMPDLFDGSAAGPDGLQDKADEIIVKGNGAKGAGDHRASEDRYERLLAESFDEARRVLKADGHLAVVFGHSDPEAWKRLLAALTAAGFVVTSSWPSRTETAVTGVATINVTVTIGCRVAQAGRPVGIAAQVDAEVLAHVKVRCRGWDADGLALQDQLMASYGAALQVVGRYAKVITPDGAEVGLDHYMPLARRAVREAVALRLDELPLETFDPWTRFAVFWLELYGRAEVPKGESRFFAQSDSLRIEDLRGVIVEETRAGFRLRHDPPGQVTPASSAYEVMRAMAAAWASGQDQVAEVLQAADRSPTDPHLWAVVDWVSLKLPAADPVAKALQGIKRNKAPIQAAAGAVRLDLDVED